jgi:hypothetical protein
MSLRQTLSAYWQEIQGELFPFLEEAVGYLTPLHKQLVVALDMVRLESFVRHWSESVPRLYEALQSFRSMRRQAISGNLKDPSDAFF